MDLSIKQMFQWASVTIVMMKKVSFVFKFACDFHLKWSVINISSILITVNDHIKYVLFKVYEEEDQLLWCPDVLSECKVKDYLRDALSHSTDDSTENSTPEHIRDNEQVCAF